MQECDKHDDKKDDEQDDNKQDGLEYIEDIKPILCE